MSSDQPLHLFRDGGRAFRLPRVVAAFLVAAALAAGLPARAASPALPDLTPSGLTLKPSSVPLNADVSFKVKNQGKGDAAATIAWILVDNNNMATVQIEKLKAGKSKEYTVTLPPILTRLPSGTIMMEIRLDPQNSVTESNESNNSLVAPYTVNVATLPDLIVERVRVEQTQVAPPQVRVTVRVKNQGKGDAGPFDVKEWQPQNPGNFVTYPHAEGLKAGKSYELQFDVLPLALDPFTLWAQADGDNQVQEANEANNQGSGQLKIKVDKKEANLVVENLRARVSDKLYLTFRVRNIGETDVTGDVAAVIRSPQNQIETLITAVPGGLKAGQSHDASAAVSVADPQAVYGTSVVVIANPLRALPESVYSDDYASVVVQKPINVAPPVMNKQ